MRSTASLQLTFLLQSYREEYDFCKLYKFKPGQARILQHNPSTVKSSQESLASSANG